MAITANDRGSGNNNVTNQSWTITPASNCTYQAMLVLCVAYDNSHSGGSDPFSSLNDSKGNLWTTRRTALYDPGAASAGVSMRIFTTSQDNQPLTTSNTITFNTSGDNTTAKAWTLIEVIPDPGMIIQFVTSGVNTGAGTGSPTVTTGSITSGDIVVACGGAESDDTWVADGDTSNGNWSTHQHNVAGTGATGMSITSQYKIVTGTATQTYNPTLTSADCILAWIQLTQVDCPQMDPAGVCGMFGV